MIARLTIAALLCCSCGTLRDVGRTVNDIAHVACELFAVEHEAELGLSPAEWCAIHENVAPYIDSILAADRMAATKAGISGE